MKGHIRSFSPSQILRNLPRAARLLLCAMIAMLCAAYVAKAQDTGYISGTVTDKTGAAVVAADVVISSTTGSATHATTTNADGAFVVAGLPGGSLQRRGYGEGILEIFGEKCCARCGAEDSSWTSC